MFSPKKSVFVASPKEVSQRLDHVLIAHGIPLSRSTIQRLIRTGAVVVNGQPVKPSYRIREKERIEVTLPEVTALELPAESIPLEILYEDTDLIFINKPAGLVVHPAPGHDRGTLVNALLHHCFSLKDIGEGERPGIVHRLDKDTSGVMVVAKTQHAYHDLARQFKAHGIRRKYLAVVVGTPVQKTGEINLSIGRDPYHRKKISSRTKRPKLAVTGYGTLKTFKGATLMEVVPQTGRTHQIRVHFSWWGHPIVGDRLYGKPSGQHIPGFSVQRQMLHAWVLGLVHPTRKEFLEFLAPPPSDMVELLDFQ